MTGMEASRHGERLYIDIANNECLNLVLQIRISIVSSQKEADLLYIPFSHGHGRRSGQKIVLSRDFSRWLHEWA
jgi:hypothetical protein